MRRLDGEQAEEVRRFFEAAAEAARNAECDEIKCGAAVVKNDRLIGVGYNGPPLGSGDNKTCGVEWNHGKKPKHDTTCCVHAEWRAILNACKDNGEDIDGSTIFFMQVDDEGNFTDAGDPHCTVCSRLAMDAGIAGFSLWNSGGVDNYTTDEYDKASYAHHE